MERYCNLSHLPALPNNVIQEALSAKYSLNLPSQVLFSTAAEFINTEFTKKILEKFPNSNSHVQYRKNPPMSLYDWHTDVRRTCSLNWVIETNPGARTLFKFDSDNKLLPRKLSSIEEIKYELHKPTLMRVWIPHCVINPYPEERIILSLSVREASYDELKNYLMGLNITEY
jgi:hypothetical protein